MAATASAPPPVRIWRRTVSPTTFRRVADAALIVLTMIVFTGAAVRLSGSGLGCSDWPTCKGARIVPELSSHSIIEYGNRMLTSVVLVPCVLAALLVYRRRPFRADLVRPALVLPLGVLAQAVLGGLTVIFDLHWELVIGHYLLSVVLLVAAVTLVRRARREPSAEPVEHAPWLVWATRALTAVGAYIVVAGTFATAAGPHAGGAGTGDVVVRLDAWGNSTLKDLIYLHGHSAAVWGFGAVILWGFAVWRRAAGRELRYALTAVCILTAAQGVVGLVQYHNALPSEVVWFHASLASILWSCLVWAWLAAGRPTRAPAVARAATHAA